MRDKRWGSHSRDLAHVQAEGVLKHQYDQGKSTGVLCSDLKLFFIFFLHSRKHLSDWAGYQIGLEILTLSACPNKSSQDTQGLASCVFYLLSAPEISPAPAPEISSISHI